MTWDSVGEQRYYAFFIQKLGRRIAHCGLFLYELEVPDNVGCDGKGLRLGSDQTHGLRRCLAWLEV